MGWDGMSWDEINDKGLRLELKFRDYDEKIKSRNKKS